MSSVDNIAASLAQTTITDSPATNGAEKSPKSARDEAVLLSAAEGRRLYIGNLAYATTEEQLKDFFKGYAIESTSIPVNPRTTRPVGYAFVDLQAASEAERAISELSGGEILDRKVSVQLARKPGDAGDKAEGGISGGEAGSGGEGNRRRGTGRGRGRGRGIRGGRGGRGGRTDNVLPLTDTTNTAPNTTESAEATTGDNAKSIRTPRPPKQRGPPEDGVPSKTKVMVANLPYDLSEEKLKDLFVNYEPLTAKIALRPIPRFMVKKLQARNEPRKGRGFGFVTLSSEEMQQKAVAEMNGKDIDGREIAVKVAIDSPGKEDEDINAPAAEAAADKIENGTSQTRDA